MNLPQFKMVSRPVSKQVSAICKDQVTDTIAPRKHVRYMHATTNNTVWTRLMTPLSKGGFSWDFIRLSSTYQSAPQPWQLIPRRHVTRTRFPAAAFGALQNIQSPYAFGNTSFTHDLRRFLEEIGTNPREARYWLKHFRNSTEPYRPFAIIQLDQQVFKKPDLLDQFGSALAFLHRNNMNCVVVHGHQVPNAVAITREHLQSSRVQIANESMMLVSILESHGAAARPLFSGSHILQAEPRCCFKGHLKKINTEPIKWAMSSGHIPIITSIGESKSGQLLKLDLWQVTSGLSVNLQPLKVMSLNASGGITDEKGEIIPNINIAANLEETFSKAWCTNDIKERISKISVLLDTLPSQSAVIITSANQLLAELFTHHGSGTFIRNTEPIRQYNNMDDLDAPKLIGLLNKSFGKDLREDYFRKLKGRTKKVFLSECYNAAAIITEEPEIDVPYLDKFAVSQAKQGEGISDMLWDCLRKKYKQLFWRSRTQNRINPWYFKKCEGSWSNGEWIVFWYGITNHRQSSALVDHALTLPSSFGSVVTGADNTLVE